MKILFLSISYNENKKNIYTDLIDELVLKGHYVTIISSNTNTMITNDKYQIFGFSNDITQIDSLISKGINTLLIGQKFKKIIKKHFSDSSFDLILYATPPITFNGVVSYCKRKFGCKSYLMLKDIFPQNAVDLEMFNKFNPIYWYFRYKEKQLYKISDHIGCMSKGNITYLLSHNKYISAKKVDMFCNSIKVSHKEISKNPNRKETVFIFGGNIGKPQNIKGLLKIINNLKDFPLAQFIIIGDGTEKNQIISFLHKNKLNNLKYYDFIPRNDYEKMLQEADVGIISLDPRFTIPNIPSKLPSYMNLHKPILAITDINTDLKEIIIDADCGWWFNANNQEEIIEGIKSICLDKSIQCYKGEKGYQYLRKNYDVTINVKQLEKYMEEQI